MGTLTIVRGPSGTGKSTRVELLLDYLVDRYDYDILHHDYITSAGNVRQGETGRYFPDINTLLVGQYTKHKQSGEYRWTSLDGLRKDATNGMIMMGDLLRSHNDKHVVVEGYQPANPSSFRVRARYVLTKGKYIYTGIKKQFQGADLEGLGYDRHLKMAFMYDTLEQAQERVGNRGGTAVNDKSPCWRDNDSNRVWHNREQVRISNGEFGEELLSIGLPWDADINVVKDTWLKFKEEI